MPTLADFYGISIRMYLRGKDHNPPHIHAKYGEYTASISIVTGEIIDGEIPLRALQLVREWLNENRDKLMKVWETQAFERIPPLN